MEKRDFFFSANVMFVLLIGCVFFSCNGKSIDETIASVEQTMEQTVNKVEETVNSLQKVEKKIGGFKIDGH